MAVWFWKQAHDCLAGSLLIMLTCALYNFLITVANEIMHFIFSCIAFLEKSLTFTRKKRTLYLLERRKIKPNLM